jgi:hypothetical protein
MSVIAAIRPDDVNFPLFLHVLGAGLLVGMLFAVGFAVVLGWRRDGDTLAFTRFGLRTLLIGVFPAYVLMRVGAEWTAAEEDLPGDPAWIGIGYITADAGAVFILISMILSGIGLVKLRKGGGVGLGRAVGIISLLLLAAYIVAVWAMTAKPD